MNDVDIWKVRREQIYQIFDLVVQNKLDDAVEKFDELIKSEEFQFIKPYHEEKWDYRWRFDNSFVLNNQASVDSLVNIVYQKGDALFVKFLDIIERSSSQSEALDFIKLKLLVKHNGYDSATVRIFIDLLIKKENERGKRFNPEFRFAYSNLLEHQGKYLEAIDEIRLCIEAEEDCYATHEFKLEKKYVEVLLKNGQIEDAEKHIDKMKEFYKNKGVNTLHFQRGFLDFFDDLFALSSTYKNLNETTGNLESKVHNLESRQSGIIELLAVFISLFTFISVNVQIFTKVQDLFSAVIFMDLMAACTILILLSMFFLINPEKHKNIRWALIGLITVIASLLFTIYICNPKLNTDDKKQLEKRQFSDKNR